MPILDPASIYSARLASLEKEHQHLRDRDHLLTWSKISLLVGIAAIFFIFHPRWFWFLPPAAMLLVLIVLHEIVLRRKARRTALIAVNSRELEALDHRHFPGRDDGREYDDPEHPYCRDLLLFGPRSLFHFINRCTTGVGKGVLAGWLKSPAAVQEIRDRQQAVKELAGQLNLRQEIEATGETISDTAETMRTLSRLLRHPYFLAGRRLPVAFIHAWTAVSVATLVGVCFGLPFYCLFLAMLVSFGLHLRFRSRIDGVFRLCLNNTRVLNAYVHIIAAMETTAFHAPKLQALRCLLSADGRPASRRIARLATLLNWFEIRQNGMMAFLLNSILCWDLHCVWHIERWRRESAADCFHWLRAVGGFEALCSLANLHFNHPDWVMPEILDNGFRLEAEGLGHPLLSAGECVRNDFYMPASGSAVIITGPNMAGKSTFLRAIGASLVMAQAGAPVFAHRFDITPVKIVTSMQVGDNLDRGLSLFYAELQRLKKILDALGQELPVFFIVDEMLKGTNMLDRQAGASALLRQLISSGANGIVATHDMELTKLEHEFPIRILNYHFDGYVDGDQLRFDYTLKLGVCLSHNALELMRRIGIRV